MYDLSKTFVTGSGKINPGGFVRVCSIHAPLRRNISESDGLAIWHPELMPFGKTCGFRASVSPLGRLLIREANGRFHTTIRSDDAMQVVVWPGFIAQNGYVGTTVAEFGQMFEAIVSSWESRWCTAIDRANAGERPGHVDNSPFTKVLGEFTAHQRVVIVDPIIISVHGKCRMVFDL